MAKNRALSLPVDVIDNGTRQHWTSRQAAIDCYFEAMVASEGSAKERYSQIYTELKYGNSPVVSDGSKEIAQAANPRPVPKGKDDIIKLIEANKLGINSPEIFDIGEGKLLVEDRDVIKALLEQEGWYAAQYLRKYIENDKELVMAASCGSDGHGEISGRGLAYASEALQDDKAFVLEMLKVDAADFRHVSERLANDAEVVATALQYAAGDYDLGTIKECIGTQLFVDMATSYHAKMRGAMDLNDVIAQAEHIRDGQPKGTSQPAGRDEAKLDDER